MLTQYLRQCSGHSDFPYPTAMVRSRWSTDELSRGSYTEYPKHEDGKLLSETLAAPVHHVIYFAGEATSHRYSGDARAVSGRRPYVFFLGRILAKVNGPAERARRPPQPALPRRYLSTVQGAALSGVREADRVLERVEASRQESAFCLQRSPC